MARHDPAQHCNFRLEFDGVAQLGFHEVSGLDAEIEPVEYRDGTDTHHTRLLPGDTHYAHVRLRRAVSAGPELSRWFQAADEGQVQRKEVTIVLVDEHGHDVARWEVRAAWPCRYEGPTLSPDSSCVLFESVELCHEGLTRVR